MNSAERFTAPQQSFKILLSAYSCEPGRGSEPGVGWNVAWEISQFHRVWVLTRPDESQAQIEAELVRRPNPNLQFVYFTVPFWPGGWQWGLGPRNVHYYLWQLQAYWVGRRLHRQIGFDLVHHVTYVRYSTPSFLSLLPIPFVWGPVGGGETAPQPFWRDFSGRAKLYERLRCLTHRLGEVDPFTHLTVRQSQVIKATTEDTARRIRGLGGESVQVESAIALTDAEITYWQQLKFLHPTPFRYISMARLLHWKGLHLGLRAFAQANLPEAEYWLLGEGPERDHLKQLAIKLGISEQVHFWGEVPREEAIAKLGQSHVLVHPSLHDSGAWVCLEAMAAGRPVICLALGGPNCQVTEQTGFKIPARTPDQAVKEIAHAMVCLAKNPELCQTMGQAGQKRVKDNYRWSQRGQQWNQVYYELIQRQLG